MIKFLITAAFVLVFVFILFLLLSLMAWIAGKVLRSLFPDKFKGKAGTTPESGCRRRCSGIACRTPETPRRCRWSVI